MRYLRRASQTSASLALRAGLFLLEVRLGPGEDLLGVLGRVGVGINLADNALLVDYEGRTRRETALAQDAIRLGGLLVRIGEERVGEFFFLGELLLRVERIDADSQQHGIELSKLLSAVAITAALDRSAPRHGFGEEEEDHVFLT